MSEPLSKLRARHALNAIEALAANPAAMGNYLSYVKALPATILKNGLGQAMAMEAMAAGNDRGHEILCRHLTDWLIGRRGKSLFPAVLGGVGNELHGQPEFAKLNAALTHANATQENYVRAQAEALAYLDWLKKFAVAFLTRPDQPGTAQP